MPAILNALRSIFRGFRRRPGFVGLTVLTLGLGIGANAAIFSVVNAVLIRPLPYVEPDRIVAVWHTAPGIQMPQFEQSDATYVLYRKYNRVLEDLAIYWDGAVTLTGGQEPARLRASGATASMFHVLRVPPAVGRTLQEGDEKPGAEPVVVLSHALWRQRFGGARGVIGRLLPIDGVPRRVVGVMPAAFHFPEPETELWIPMTIDPANLQAGNFNYDAIGRLRPGVTPERAARELSNLVLRIPEEIPGSQISAGMIQSARLAVLVHPLRDDVVGDVQRILWVLLGSVGVILIIACANVANLFLVRAEGRQREVAVRTALGGTRRDIARLFLSESVVLALLGGALGLALAAAGVRLLVALRPEGIPRLDEIGVDGAVLAFTVGLSILSGLLFGLFAVLRYGGPELVAALKEGGRGGTVGRERHRARNALVVVQVALALVLLVCAGLMTKSFWRLRNVNPGIDPRGVLTIGLSLPETEYRDAPARALFVRSLVEKVRALPGVTAAGTINMLPLSGGGSTSGYSFADLPLPPDAVPPILGTRYASPEYFQALGIPLLEGRLFQPLDPARRSDDVIVSQALARRFWPGKSALGKRLVQGLKNTQSWHTIVGVVGSVREDGLEKDPKESVYYPMLRTLDSDDVPADGAPSDFTLVVRGRVDPSALAAPVRGAIRALDPNLPVARVRSMQEVVSRSMARTSFTMLLLAIAAAVALLLGSIGIYGVIAYIVSQRTREIGVRMALGARREDVSRMVLRQGLFLSIAGVVCGLAAALGATRLLRALLFEVSPLDPTIFAAVPLLLAAVALLASWLPARRAASIEPLEAIRYE
jgi:putative ABC transport system permease protein